MKSYLTMCNNGAKTNLANDDGVTPLMRAVQIDKTETCLEAQLKQVDLDSLCGESGSWYLTEL